ncbi:MAG: hypothetical protein F4103_08395 [Boseongicola sp. SB0673_bin_14]|nr:hypothetical protein [Boseongicola sp. SB0673_bin_14]
MMTALRQFVVLTILALAMVAVAIGTWQLWSDPGQPRPRPAPESVAEARVTAAPLYISDARESAARLAEGGFRLSRLTVQFLLFLGIVNLVWQFGKWVLARPPLAEIAAPALGPVAIVGLALAFMTLGPPIASMIGGMIAVAATLGASEGQSFATVAAGEGILPSGVMVEWVERLVAWVGEAGADPASWAYLGCAFFSVVLVGIVLGASVVIYAELFLVSGLGIVVLGFAEVHAGAARQDASPAAATRFGAAETLGATKRYLTIVFGKGVKLVTLLVAVDATGRTSREIGHAAWAGTLEDALGVVLLQVACVVVLLVLPAALERRVVLGVGS